MIPIILHSGRALTHVLWWRSKDGQMKGDRRREWRGNWEGYRQEGEGERHGVGKQDNEISYQRWSQIVVMRRHCERKRLHDAALRLLLEKISSLPWKEGGYLLDIFFGDLGGQGALPPWVGSLPRLQLPLIQSLYYPSSLNRIVSFKFIFAYKF